MDRFLRHRLLPEIGDEGQRRLERTVLPAMGGPAGAVRDLYLERAGITIDTAHSKDGSLHAPATDLHAASAVLAGAFEAVEALKRALDVGRPGRLDWSAVGLERVVTEDRDE